MGNLYFCPRMFNQLIFNKMKVYLIKASAGSSYSEYKAETGGPPQNIFAAAAAMPEGVDIAMCDETIGMKTDFDSDADVVAVFMSTPDAYRAYEITSKFHDQGKITLLGGLHTFFMCEEAAQYADALIIGESEGLWEQILFDATQRNMQPRYKREKPLDLAELKPYPTDIISPEKYNGVWSVVITRGCPMHCDFCLVHKFFDKFKLRPIAHIVEEVKALKAQGVEWVELHSDNLTQNKEYALELFEALAPLGMNFYGETTILIAKDAQMLAAAKKAGVKALLFGIETPSEKALKEQGKQFVKPAMIKEYVRTIQSYGIQVVGDFLFGFDAHDKGIFNETIDFIREINVDVSYPHLVIPFPGSETFKKLEAEGRILTKDWSKYDGTHVVYTPTQMTPKELEEGTWRVYEKTEKWNKTMGDGSQSTLDTSKRPWKTLIALALLPVALWFNLISFFFALFFLYWSIQGIRQKYTFFFDVISRKEYPVLYWMVSMLWLVLSLVSLYYSEPIMQYIYE